MLTRIDPAGLAKFFLVTQFEAPLGFQDIHLSFLIHSHASCAPWQCRACKRIQVRNCFREQAGGDVKGRQQDRGVRTTYRKLWRSFRTYLASGE